ncbi:MAG: ATP-dependent Clp protease proteolytic subunit, partial [Akkermansia sp.]
LAKHTDKTAEQVDKDSDRDNYMTAEEAAAYGLVDQVLTHHNIEKSDSK